MSNDIFYFAALTRRKNRITVIDLANCVSYEREDWWTVDNINFDNPQEAIDHAKRLANIMRIIYEPFESRYDSSLNEMCY